MGKQLYELSFWIKLNADTEKELEKIINLIQKNEGEIVYKDIPQKKEMAYPINKEKVGYFSYIVFKAPKDKIERIKKDLLFFKNLLRYLIIKRKILFPKEKV